MVDKVLFSIAIAIGIADSVYKIPGYLSHTWVFQVCCSIGGKRFMTTLLCLADCIDFPENLKNRWKLC